MPSFPAPSGQQQQQQQQQQLQQNVDEIKQFLEGRYVSAAEAFWRLFAFAMHAMQPHVMRLPVHLENGQQITFAADALPEDIANQPLPATKLTAYFALNTSLREAAVDAEVWAERAAAAAEGCDPDSPQATAAAEAAAAAAAALAAAKQYTYQDVCRGYTWDGSGKQWRARKQRRCALPVGRMYLCSPAAGERYFLRLLLTTVKGACSFEELRTVGGVMCSLYQDAAAQLGLFQDGQVCVSPALHLGQASIE